MFERWLRLKRRSGKRRRSSRRLRNQRRQNVRSSEWADLPTFAVERILEKLPLSDYVRFAGVCVRWRDAQRRHRSAHSPSPPPMLSLPWFYLVDFDLPRVPYLCPFERRHGDRRRLISHHLENPIKIGLKNDREAFARQPQLIIGPCSNCGGWLVVADQNSHVHLLNPISGRSIILPRLNLRDFSHKAFLAPPPHYALFVIRYGDERLFMIREGDKWWIELRFPAKLYHNSICIGNDLYTIVGNWDIAVVRSAQSPPAVDKLTMDKSQLSSVPEIGRLFPTLVESDGQLLLVLERGELGIQVFEADLTNKQWVRKRSIGDRILIISLYASLSLPVSGLPRRFKRNHIYHYPIPVVGDDNETLWTVFDLGTGKIRHRPFLGQKIEFHHKMFVPSIC